MGLLHLAGLRFSRPAPLFASHDFFDPRDLVQVKYEMLRLVSVEKQPVSTWNEANAEYYGFWANVNPNVPTPTYSQATERRLGEFLMRRTLMFNGYAEQVASLYAGMDLKKLY